MKKGEGNKNFAKRWFILKGNLLFYLEKKTDREPIGVIILEGSTIELAESEMEQYFCFKIVFPSRTYVLSAESQQVMEQWMKSLACASYDYVKLMAAELQRQLDELSGPPVAGSFSGFEDNFLQATASPLRRNHTEAASTKSVEPKSSSSHHVPTPPPRSKNSRNIRSNEKHSFEYMHKEFGAKILRDQESRWAASRDNQSKKAAGPRPAQLSVLKQTSLIDL